MSRPEHIAPPELFYNADEAQKYGYNSHMIKTQTELAERAIQLLQIPEGEPAYILDIGTGSGLSGEVLTEHGYEWVGTDISQSMLGVALQREVEGDLVYSDMGQGLTFRPGTFDGCISISALQWLCNADRSDHIPKVRLRRFFTSLYAVLVSGARAIFQFYPDGPEQLAMIQFAALSAGFNGGVIIDYPNSTKAKKYYLCLFAGESRTPGRKNVMPKALGVGGGDDDDGDDDSDSDGVGEIQMMGKVKRKKRANRNDKKKETRKQWLLKQKERLRAKGVDVPHDSKRTGKMPKVPW